MLLPQCSKHGVLVADVADEGTLEDKLPDDQLRAMLKNQLEYYFSRYLYSVLLQLYDLVQSSSIESKFF